MINLLYSDRFLLLLLLLLLLLQLSIALHVVPPEDPGREDVQGGTRGFQPWLAGLRPLTPDLPVGGGRVEPGGLTLSSQSGT